jgi:hypothetical protein
MIKAKDYKNMLKACKEVMPLLSQEISSFDEDKVFNQLDEIRKMFKVVETEFACYDIYPRHKLDKYYEVANELEEFTKSTNIEIKWLAELDVVMDETNWATYNKIDVIARFYYREVEITRLIKL